MRDAVRYSPTALRQATISGAGTVTAGEDSLRFLKTGAGQTYDTILMYFYQGVRLKPFRSQERRFFAGW